VDITLRRWAGVVATLVVIATPASLAAETWGTANADLTCGGYPEARCGPAQLVGEHCGRPGLGDRLPLALASNLRTSPQWVPRRSATMRADGAAHRAFFEVQPLWLNSGRWAPDGTLLLADVMRGTLLRYLPTGEFAGAIGRQQVTTLQHPSSLQTAGPATVIKDLGGHFIVVEQGYRASRSWNLLPGGVGGGRNQLRSIYTWSLMGQYMLAFGDLRLADGTWRSAYVRIPLSAPEKFEILQSLAPTDPTRGFYLLGYPSTANLDTTGYFLSREERPAIYEVPSRELSLRLRRICVLPRGLSGSSWRSSSVSLVARYSAMQETFSPTALYAWGKHLFVLVHRPVRLVEREGIGQWFLAKIDPRTGSFMGGVFLPTRAQHLTLVPGASFWALIEKGPVRAAGRQEIPSMVLIPTTWIAGDDALSAKEPSLGLAVASLPPLPVSPVSMRWGR
jgi:hypothetical protein